MSEESFLSPRSKDLIRKFMLGGALLGGGTMLAADLANWIGHLNRKKEDEDDDTLYIYRDRNQVKSAGVGTGIAIAGGVGSAIGSGLLVHHLYTKMRRAEAQKELDKAQRAFIDVQGYKEAPKKKKKDEGEGDKKEGEMSKKSSSLSLGETVMSAPVALPLLLALGAGVTSYGMLDNAYPIKRRKPKAPRKIQIVEKPEDDQEEYSQEKTAAYGADDAREFLVRWMYADNDGKSDIANLVGAVSDGDGAAFKKAASAVGFVNALETVKGGRNRVSDPMAEHMAISYISKEASIKHQVGVVAAGEFATKYPTMYKAACALDPEDREALYKIACILGCAIRAERSQELGIKVTKSMVKESSMAMQALAGELDIPAALETALSLKKKQDSSYAVGSEDDVEDVADRENTATEGDSDESTGTSGQEAGIHDPSSPSRKPAGRIIASGKTARKMMDAVPPDVIDKILQP